MSITPVRDPVPGERVIALSPADAAEAAAAWLRRPHIFPGRALTQNALQQSQDWAAGHLAKRGQDWVAGIVDGLELMAQPAVTGDGFAATQLHLSPGRGLATSGEDVVLTRSLQCLLADVPVVAPPGFFVDGSGVGPGDADLPPSLRPRGIGISLGELAAASLATLPPVGVLLLQPVRVETTPLDPSDPCEHNACDEGTVNNAESHVDWRSADAVRLLWFAWPPEWRPLPDLPAAQWRNALAWSIFQAESELDVDATLPWEDWGVPIALVNLDAARLPLWLDRASVVRDGGRARDARLFAPAAGLGGPLGCNSRLPSLWQAQIEQLAEQITAAGEPSPAADQLADAFSTRLPPVGLLPKNAFEPAKRRSGFFPAGFDVDAVPVPIEQLDLAVRASASLAPLNPSAAESVRLLVPVPLQSWEPRLLQTELIDPLFQQTLDENLLRRARTLGMRQGLRYRAAMLAHALNGLSQPVPPFRDDPLALENEALTPWGEPPPGGGHRSTVAVGQHQHFFDNASPSFTVPAGWSIFTWVCLDPDNPPTELMLQWHTAGNWEHRAYWGDDQIKLGTANTVSRTRMGDLPPAGQWVMLKIPAEKVGLANQALDGMSFMLFGGRAAYGLTGARTDFQWTKWFCNFLPLGAHVQGDEAWDLLTPNDLWAPFEPHDGVVPSLPELLGSTDGDVFSTPGTQTRAVPISGFNIDYPNAAGWRGHTVGDFNGVTLAANGSDRLSIWVYLDELTPPRSLLSVVVGKVSPTAPETTRFAFWGENHLAQLAATSSAFKSVTSAERAGALPQSGSWVQLTLPVPPFAEVASELLVRVRLLAFDGAVAFSELVRYPAATPTVPQRLWPLSIVNRTSTTPPYSPLLNATLVPQNNLGVLTPTPSSRIGTVRIYTELVSDPLIRKLSGHEQSQLLLRGLSGFADYLRTRIDRADDITDFGFAHMQVDIYRMRQLTMSTTDASRLAVSPMLAAIAKSDSAIVVQNQIRDYLGTVKASASLTRGLALNAATVASAAPPSAPTVFAAASSLAINTNLAINGSFEDVRVAPRSNLLSSRPLTSGRVLLQPRAPLPIVYSAPIIGASEVRTTAIADRLRNPPSPEARDYALLNRRNTVNSLLTLLDQFMTEDSGEVPALLDGFNIPGLPGDPFLAGSNATSRKLMEFRTNPALLDALTRPPPLVLPPANAVSVDEAAMFTQTVALSDVTISILRQLEARLVTYRDALTRAQAALDDLQTENDASRARLAEVADDLAEARHDVSVARALISEEQERIAAVNARRAKVLDEDVKFVAYIRPRETDTLLATPTHSVDPGLLDAPVPACLREHPDTPDELMDMLRVLREAPSNWFVRAPLILQQLDRLEPMLRLMQSAQLRAVSGIALPQFIQPAVHANALALGIARVATRQVEALAPRLSAMQGFNIAAVATSTWQAVRVQAEAVVSFADLAEGGHGRADVARAAATELQNMRSVVSCLHAEFSGIPAVLRLQWAEMLSEFDAAPNLRNLSSLPRWAEIGYIDRRQMQGYVDWLFAQIVDNVPQAVALVNDVVRMCLLLASHAPVDRIVSGRMARPVTGISTGLRIPLAVLDAAPLRVGMQALLYRNDALVARALVEDLGSAEISARVIHTAADRVDLGDDVRVHFDSSAMVSLRTQASTRTLFRVP
ncbi:hypothetical protein [Rhizobacter sp. Root16D2]|uniref:hypothetical protein n=1 Tax=Rhizobacter sp. Root16D2 TaxID=1736479 RepID=UPI0006F95A79|nr:hypothetical protein [Rhizobacter sp. Root16D2]KRB18589.1 hypothetical protein ASE08_04940 [Rhizobacter sp. Root16D2]